MSDMIKTDKGYQCIKCSEIYNTNESNGAKRLPDLEEMEGYESFHCYTCNAVLMHPTVTEWLKAQEHEHE